MGHAIKKITIHFALFVFYMAFGTVMIIFSMQHLPIGGEDCAWRNIAYFLTAQLISLIISFLAQGFIREGYSLVRVSLIIVCIFVVLGSVGHIYNYFEWNYTNNLPSMDI